MVVVGQLEVQYPQGEWKEFGWMVVLWRSPVQQLLGPRDIGRSLGKLCVTKRWEKRRVGMLSVCRKSRECSAVAGEADGEAGRADGGGEREQSEFQL